MTERTDLRPFAGIEALAAKRYEGPKDLEAALPRPMPRDALAAVPDDRWLSMLSACVFSAGLSWPVTRDKWPGFEEAFHGFDPAACAAMSPEEAEAAAAEGGIPNRAKARSIPENAGFFRALAGEHASAAAWFAGWPAERFPELLDTLGRRGSRCGSTTPQYFLRLMGCDGWITSETVVAALSREGVVDRVPRTKAEHRAVSHAFAAWRAETGRPLMQLSCILSLSALRG